MGDGVSQMIYIYLYNFRGIEATFTIMAEDRKEAEARFEAMKTAIYEGEVFKEIPIADEEMNRFTGKVLH